MRALTLAALVLMAQQRRASPSRSRSPTSSSFSPTTWGTATSAPMAVESCGAPDAAPRPIGPRGVAADAVSGRAGLHAVASCADDGAVFDPQRPVADRHPGLAPSRSPPRRSRWVSCSRMPVTPRRSSESGTSASAPQSLPTAHGFDEFYGIPPDISWDAATYVRHDRATHSIPRHPRSSWQGAADRRGDGGRSITDGEAIHAGGARRDRQRLVDKSIDFMRRQKEAGKPFFLYLPFSMGHVPNLPSTGVQGKVADRQYGDKLMKATTTSARSSTRSRNSASTTTPSSFSPLTTGRKARPRASSVTRARRTWATPARSVASWAK